jgi:hypothetical protein
MRDAARPERLITMRIFALLGTPWCLFVLLLLIIVLLTIGAMSHRRARHESSADRHESLPDDAWRDHPRTTATIAPLEGLTAIHERLMELGRHLPPESADAQWLRGYAHDLRSVMDELYDAIGDGDATNPALLERLSADVARLDRAVTTQIEARLSQATDRRSLHAALDQLRRTIEDR